MKVAFISTFLEMPGIEHLSAMLKLGGHETRLFIPRELLTFVKGMKTLEKMLVNRKAILQKLKDDQYDVVGFSVLSDDYLWALDFARDVKDYCGAHKVFGNIQATSDPEAVMANDFVDSLVLGEGDHAFVELVDALETGDSDFSIPNVWIRRDGEIIKNPVRPLVVDLDSLPFPD